MWTLAVDALTAEVVGALDDASVGAILLKGPTIADWLYDDPSERPYVDSDLLVEPGGVATAHATLANAGFHQEFGPIAHGGMERPPSQPWRRERLMIDLHETLPGATASHEEVWAALRADSVRRDVAGRQVRALGHPGVLVSVALHAAHHGPGVERPLRDLARALERATREDWGAAATLAERIGAQHAFAQGLGLAPAGCELLAALGLEASYPVDWVLDRQGVPLAAGVHRLATAHGLRRKAALARDELLPSREFLRWWTPMTRGAWPGTARAYLWRWGYLLRHAPAAFRAWRRARRHM